MKIAVSRIRYDRSTQSAVIRGWMEDPSRVSRLLLKSPHEAVKAALGLKRPEILRNHPQATTEYCGFEAKIRALPEEAVTLTALDGQGEILANLRVEDWSPAPKPEEDPQVAARFLEPGISRISVLLKAGKIKLQNAELRLGDSAPQALREIPSEIAEILSGENEAAYVLASFPVPAAAAAASPLRLDLGGEILLLQEAPLLVDLPAFSLRIERAEQWTGTGGRLLVTGRIGSPAVTSVRLLVDGRLLGAAKASLQAEAGAPASLRTHFALETPYAAADLDGRKAVIEIFVGDEIVGRAERTIARRQESQEAPPPAETLNDGHGAALYEFPISPERAHAPWIVVFSSMSAWPTVGGPVARTYSLAAYLKASGYRVLLLCLGQPGGQEWASALNPYCDALAISRSAVFSGRYGHIDLQSWRRSAKAAFRVLPTIEALFRPKAFIFNYAFNMYGAIGLKTPVLLDAHDVQHQRAKNAREHDGDLEDRRCTREEERRLIAMADSVFAITQEDAQVLEALRSGRPVFAAPHALRPFANSEITEASLRRIFFVGQKYAPNVDGIRAFLRRIWPDLRRACPEIELHVAGRVCETLEDLAGPGIHLHGPRVSLSEFYASCGIALSPLPYGTGLKIKVVEALARGRCVVATEEGRRGLPLDAPLIQARLEDFGTEILRLIADPISAAKRGREAADYARRLYAPERSYRPLLARLAALEAPAPGPAPAEAELIGSRVAGADLMLKFSLRPGAEGRGFSVLLRHAGRDLCRISQATIGESGVFELRAPFPHWLADGAPHRLELFWGAQSRATISVACAPEIFEACSPAQPERAARLGFRDEIHLLDPPAALERPEAEAGSGKLKSFEVRRHGRPLAQIGGWVPSPQPQGADLLEYLEFPQNLVAGKGAELLAFHDQKTGVVEFVAPRRLLPGWGREEPEAAERSPPPSGAPPLAEPVLRIQAQGVLSIGEFRTDPALGEKARSEAQFGRLAANLCAAADLKEISLIFPPESGEETMLRWSVFIDGVPQSAVPGLIFQKGEARAVHSAALKAGVPARLELRCYPASGEEPLEEPLLCRFA